MMMMMMNHHPHLHHLLHVREPIHRPWEGEKREAATPPPRESTPQPDRGHTSMRELQIKIPRIDHEDVIARIAANKAKVTAVVDEVIKNLKDSVQEIENIEDEKREHAEKWEELNQDVKARIWNDLDALMDQHEYLVNRSDELFRQIDFDDDQDPENAAKIKQLHYLNEEIEKVALRREELMANMKNKKTIRAWNDEAKKLKEEELRLVEANDRGENVEQELLDMHDKVIEHNKLRTKIEQQLPKKKLAVSTKNKDEFESFEHFEKMMLKWQEKSRQENELLAKDPKRSPGRRKQLDEAYDLFQKSKYFKDYEKAQMEKSFELMQEQERQIIELEMKRQDQERLVQKAKERLAALPLEGVDLDEDDDTIDTVNKSIPSLMIQQMNAEEQYEMVREMQKISVKEIIDLTQETQKEVIHQLDQSLGVARYEEVPPEDVQYIEDDDEDFPEQFEEIDQPPYNRAPQPPLFERGQAKFKAKGNILYHELRMADVLDVNRGVKRENGEWHPVDAKKLVKRLVSDAHRKLTTNPPLGYKTICKFILKNPRFKELIGMRTRIELFSSAKSGRKQHRQKKKAASTFIDLSDNDEYQPHTRRVKR